MSDFWSPPWKAQRDGQVSVSPSPLTCVSCIAVTVVVTSGLTRSTVSTPAFVLQTSLDAHPRSWDTSVM